MDVAATTALVTRPDRGLGRALALELLARGASVYAGAGLSGGVAAIRPALP